LLLAISSLTTCLDIFLRNMIMRIARLFRSTAVEVKTDKRLMVSIRRRKSLSVNGCLFSPVGGSPRLDLKNIFQIHHFLLLLIIAIDLPKKNELGTK